MSLNRLLFVGIVTANILMSCALPPPVPDAVVSDKFADSSVDEVMRKMVADYGEAERDGMSLFAPSQFREGKAALSKAGELRRVQAEEMEILRQLYLAEKQLNICRQVKLQAEKQIPGVLSALRTLRAKSVMRSYADEYDSLTYQVSRLMNGIEDFVLGKPVDSKKDFAKEKALVMQQAHELEIKVVKYNTLNESKVVFKDVESMGGKRLATATFRKAEQALEEANAVIENNVKDEQAVGQAGEHYKFAVFHALHVAREVGKLESLNRSEYENYILDLEDKLQAIAEALEYRDIRNHAVTEQIQLLTGLAQRLMAEKTKLLQANNTPRTNNKPDIGNLQTEHDKALQKIQELTEQIAQLQANQAPAASAVPDDGQQFKRKAARLEQQVSELLLKYNNLKAERDSLQVKLNASETD